MHVQSQVWLQRKDSDFRSRLQGPLPYHLATPQYCSSFRAVSSLIAVAYGFFCRKEIETLIHVTLYGVMN